MVTAQHQRKVSDMQTIRCTGTSQEIGLQHGQQARIKINRSITFYERLFHETAKLSWEDVCQTASKFLTLLRRDWPGYCEELNGIAQGSGVPFLSILALNVRTEIAYGMFSDGCTALSWKTDEASFLAQNWDWQYEQAENLIRLKIHQPSKPTIDMITEAGIIGKIGLNSAGVGVCLNAIRARGVDFTKLPCHLALRACLESLSKTEAIETLHKAGVASACHILVADPTGGVGVECSHLDIIDLPMSNQNVVTHTNHFVKVHANVQESHSLPDSPFRLERINQLISSCKEDPGIEDIASLLKDEKDYPTAINRGPTDSSTIATLFSIVMDLEKKIAQVTLGRPTDGGAEIALDPCT